MFTLLLIIICLSSLHFASAAYYYSSSGDASFDEIKGNAVDLLEKKETVIPNQAIPVEKTRFQLEVEAALEKEAKMIAEQRKQEPVQVIDNDVGFINDIAKDDLLQEKSQETIPNGKDEKPKEKEKISPFLVQPWFFIGKQKENDVQKVVPVPSIVEHTQQEQQQQYQPMNMVNTNYCLLFKQ